MNCRLTEPVVRAVCRELLAKDARVTGRRLTRELRARFGAVGKAERVFRIWREETEARQERLRDKPPAGPVLPVEVLELQRRLHAAEIDAQATRERAERAELREQAHQDRWALEIDGLRQQLLAQPQYALENRRLQDKVTELTVTLAALRVQLSRQD
jgi:hypothetical protein